MSTLQDPDANLDLAEYVPQSSAVLTDAERWPTLSEAGRLRLERLRTHPQAPEWIHSTGDRLTADAIERVQRPLPLDGWLDQHLATARALPAYRRRDPAPTTLSSFPIVSRGDLLDDVSAFVPLDADLDRMVQGTSSGTTGASLIIPDDIEEIARTFHLLVSLVRHEGVDWQPDLARMALAQVVHQRQAFTYAGILSSFGQASMARLNLHPASWRDDDHRTSFVADQDPQVISGNPTSLSELLHPDLVANLHPLALISGAMSLSTALREALGTAYACPVIDVYGLHETRSIAASADGGPFVVLDRRIHVEIVDPEGEPVAPGERGEIVVTAGENPLLPLVRYRTSDFARLVEVDGRPALVELEGREATTFLAADGSRVASVDLTQHLQTNGALGWAVEQRADGAVTATVAGGDAQRISRALGALLGREVPISRVTALADLGEGKPRRYRSSA